MGRMGKLQRATSVLTTVALALTLVVVGVGLGLSAVESRDDRDVLIAVGAKPVTLRRMAGVCEVWVADPGRAYLPEGGRVAIATYAVPTSLELEDSTLRSTTLFRLFS